MNSQARTSKGAAQYCGERLAGLLAFSGPLYLPFDMRIYWWASNFLFSSRIHFSNEILSRTSRSDRNRSTLVGKELDSGCSASLSSFPDS